jgi:hypothetical protein
MYVGHLMQLACTQMATLFVSHVTPIPKAKVMFTLIKCPPMYNYEVQPSGCKSGTSQKRFVNNTGSTKTETFYASIISTMLESLKAVR